MDSHAFLKALTVVLCLAALTTLVFQRWKQPVVLGYIIAGLIIGPHVPIPLVAEPAIVQTLSELGVILLMFSLGLEFSLKKLVRVGPTAGLTAVIQSSVMIWLGFVTGQAFGWTVRESFFAGAIVAISSTTIIAKVFDDLKIRGDLRELVVGVLIVEDLIAIMLMAILTAISTGHEMSASALAATAGRLAAFLVGLVGIGMLIVPRAVRAVVEFGRPETTLVSAIGLCFAIALLAQQAGYSVALGAFLAGSLVAESGDEKAIAHLIEPVRDMFAAIFFVSVGMLIDPDLVAQHWGAVLVLTGVVIVGKIVSVSFGAFLTGYGTRTSIQAGMSLAQIGEFSFIIAALGKSLGATADFLYPVAVAVSAITTLTTPWLIRSSGVVASHIDRRLPHAIQTFASLYGSWLEQLRASTEKQREGAVLRRLLRLLALDTVVLAVLIISAAVTVPDIAAYVADRLELGATIARFAVLGGIALFCAPFLVGILRITRQLGIVLADRALPEVDSQKVDLAAAPRRAMIVTLQLAVVLVVGTPLVALTQPFVPGAPPVVTFLLVVGAFGIALWRSAANLQGHVRAGAQVIVEALASQSRAREPAEGPYALTAVHNLLPGLGDLVFVRLDAPHPGAGKSLAQLDLRGLTGATVLAITRGEQGLVVPTADEVLAPGDVLAVSGTHEAVRAAIELLQGTDAPEPSPTPGGAGAEPQ